MAKTLIDLNEAVLTQAQRILGTKTKKDTVDQALREVVRRAAAEELGRLVSTGIFVDLHCGDA
jgi:Arc/MetJ family transcription regulator